MSDALKDFFISIGFAVDGSSLQRAERTVSQSEARLTQSTVNELNKRQKAVDKALADRVNAVVSVNGELDAEEKAAAARFLKTQQETADKAKKLEEESEKKSRERREAGYKNAQAFILQFAALATKVAVAVEGAALGIVYATDKAAKSFEGLNYAAKWTGASPQGITAFAYAISQLGGNAESAQASLDAFGKKLTGPAGAAFEQQLNSLGVRTRDAAGKLRDSAAIATDALQTLGKRPQAEAMAFAEAWSFDDTTRRAGADPRLRQYEDQATSDQARIGADPNAAAQAGTAFEQSMRHLEEVASSVATKIDTNLFKKIQPLLDALAKWMTDHGGQIADIADRIANDLVRLATAMGEAFAKVDWDAVLTKTEHFFEEFDKLTRKYFGQDGLTAVFEAFGAVIAANVTVKLLKMVDALRTLTGIPLFTRLLSLLGIGGLATGGLAAALLADSATPANEGEPTVNKDGSLSFPGGKTVPGKVFDGGSANLRDRRGMGHNTVPEAAGVPSDMKERGLAAMQYLVEKKGWTPEAAAIAVGNAQQESSITSTGRPGDPNTPGGSHYMFQWNNGKNNDTVNGRRARYEAFAAARGKSPTDFYTSLDFMDEERKHRSNLERNWDKVTDLTSAGALSHAYEGYGDNSTGTRVQNAANWLAAYRAKVSNASRPHMMGSEPRLPPRAMYWAHDSKGNRVAVDAQGRAVKDDGSPTTVTAPPAPPTVPDLPSMTQTPPLGPTPGILYQYDQSRKRGDVSQTNNFNIQGSDVKQNLEAARLTAGRGTPDWIANLQGAEQ